MPYRTTDARAFHLDRNKILTPAPNAPGKNTRTKREPFATVQSQRFLCRPDGFLTKLLTKKMNGASEESCASGPPGPFAQLLLAVQYQMVGKFPPLALYSFAQPSSLLLGRVVGAAGLAN